MKDTLRANSYGVAMERDRVVELVFEVEGGDCLFVAASAAADCTVVGERAIRRTDGALLEYFSVEGTPVADALAAIRDHDASRSARVVHDGPGRTLVEVILDGACVASTLADENAVIRSATAEGGVATVVADVPAGVESADVIETFLARHDGARLVSKTRRRARLPGVADTDAEGVLSALTEKQRRALETALAGGYFDWPRRSSAAECAAALGVSQPTFSQHLRHAQARVYAALFAVEGPPSAGAEAGSGTE